MECHQTLAEHADYSAESILQLAESVIDASGGETAIFTAQAGISSNEWMLIATSRLKNSKNVSTYAGEIEAFIAQMYQGNLNNTQPTQWYRMILATLACGGNPKNVAGHDLLADGIYYHAQFSAIERQGINGLSWALLAMDAAAEQAPEDADYNRKKLIDGILSLQHSDGSYSLMGAGDPDVTAMAVQALAPYYNNETVGAAIDRALAWLSYAQQPAGDYVSYGYANAESTAQVVLALTALGIDVQRDGRFIKDGNTAIDGLLTYKSADGRFSHILGEAANGLATSQSLLALSAIYRFYSGQSFIYRFGSDPAQLLESERAPVVIETTEVIATKDSEPETSTEAIYEEIETINTTENISEDTIAVELTTEISVEEESNDEATTAELITKDSNTGDGNTEESITAESNIKESDSAENISLEDSASATTSETDRATEDSSNTEESSTEATTKKDVTEESFFGKKFINILLIILLLASIVVSVLKPLLRKVTVPLAFIIAIILIVINLNIQSVDEHYSQSTNAQTEKTVEISILCHTAIANKDKLPEGLLREHALPEDGIIYEGMCSVNSNDTVFDILMRVARENKIQIDYTGGEDSAYIRGIGYLYEYDCGDLSGWMYKVNDTFPGVSCGDYAINEADRIVWEYTCDLGRDIGNTFTGE